MATTKYSDIGEDSQPNNPKQGYGYHVQLYRRGYFGHEGSFGQLCFISPNDKVVIAATSRKQNFQEFMDLIYNNILDRLDENQPFNMNDYSRLQDRLSHTTVSTPKIRPIPKGIPYLKNVSYIMDQNPDELERLNISLDENILKCQFVYKEKESKFLNFNFNEPVSARDIFVKDLSLHEQEAELYACWLNNDVLELTMIYLETPYVATYLLAFNGDGLTLSFNMNISLGKFSPATKSNYKINGKKEQ